MKSSKVLVGITLAVALLAIAATIAGLFWPSAGDPVPFRTIRGEQVELYGHGLYRFDSVSYATQAVAQDIVTLAFGIPLLLASLWAARNGSIRGRLFLTGTLAYFLYTYAAFVFLSAYNEFFLVYTALFTLCLWGLILALSEIDINRLPGYFRPTLPRRMIATIFFAIGGFLLMAWMGRIVPPLLAGTPPFGLESYSTLVLQGMDLSIIIPWAFLSGVLLLRRAPAGYLLASLLTIKGLSLGLALLAMVIGQVARGIPTTLPEAVFFSSIFLAAVAVTTAMFRHMQEAPGA
jgi:hypothetical protein